MSIFTAFSEEYQSRKIKYWKTKTKSDLFRFQSI